MDNKYRLTLRDRREIAFIVVLEMLPYIAATFVPFLELALWVRVVGTPLIYVAVLIVCCIIGDHHFNLNVTALILFTLRQEEKALYIPRLAVVVDSAAWRNVSEQSFNRSLNYLIDTGQVVRFAEMVRLPTEKELSKDEKAGDHG